MAILWLINPPETNRVPAVFSGGHVLAMAYSEITQHVMTASRYFENDVLAASKLHRFDSSFDPDVGIARAEITSTGANDQYVDVVAAGNYFVALRQLTTDVGVRYVLDVIEPFTMTVENTMEVFECSLMAVPGISVVWLIGRTGLIKRLEIASMSYSIEKSYPSNTTYGRGVVDPIMEVFVVSKTASAAEIFDLATGEKFGAAPFPWQGPNLQAMVVIPPHGEVEGVTPPIIALTAYDPSSRGMIISYFDRDLTNKNYTPRYYELPICVGPIPPNGQRTGYVGQAMMLTTIDGRPPGSQAEVNAVPAKRAARLVVIARNGFAPSANQAPLAYFIGRRVDLATGGMVTLFSAGLNDCNPFKQHILTTHETATVWMAGHSLENAEQRAYLCRTIAM